MKCLFIGKISFSTSLFIKCKVVSLRSQPQPRTVRPRDPNDKRRGLSGGRARRVSRPGLSRPLPCPDTRSRRRSCDAWRPTDECFASRAGLRTRRR